MSALFQLPPAVAAGRDMLLGLAPWLPTQRRYGLESLQAHELSDALARDVPGAQLESLRIEVESRGTTDRARIHLGWNTSGRNAGLPSSAFAKGTSTVSTSRAVVSAFGCHTYESRFYTQIYPAVPDLTLRPFLARSGTGGRYVIAFEDLRQRGAVRLYNADDEAPLRHVQGVIDLLARLHGRFWRSSRFSSDLRWLQTYAKRPGYPFMKQLFRLSEFKFVRSHPDLPEPIKRLTRSYAGNQDRLTRIWEAMPQTLCHGDCHLGNTFSNPDGSAGIYDWQVFHRMNGLRDFAYFMMHSVPTAMRREHEKGLLRRYLDELAHAGAGREAPDFESAWDTYRLLIVDGWIAIAFTMAVGGMQPQDRMQVTLERAVATMLDLDLAGRLARELR